MSTDIVIKIKNMDEIERMFRKAPAKITDGVHKAIQNSIRMIHSKALREAPVNKQSGGGNLRQSIKSSMRGKAVGEVTVGAEYGVYVHEGTRPHEIRPVSKKALANRRTGQFFGRLVRHPGTKANPFLQRAVDLAQGDVDKEFDKVLKNAFS